MKLASQVKTATRNLLTSKLRTFLAMLSIMVGTASVVALVSAGQLAAEEALVQFKTLGTNLMSISFSPSDTKKGAITPVTMAAMDLMLSTIPDIYEMAPYMTGYSPVSFQETTTGTAIIASTESLADIINIHFQQGRFLTDLDTHSHYCVLGHDMLTTLHSLSPLGSQIKVGNAIFTVIGIAEHWPENSFFANNINASVIIPIESMHLISKDQHIANAVMKLTATADVDSVKNAITQFFAKNFPEQVITVQSAKEMILRMSAQQQIFTLLLGLIGSIALLVGGIGVMNIMLASVAERRGEIGLRLALGAQPKDIQLMFIMESLMLALVSGGLGVVVGILSTVLIAKAAGWTFTFFIIPPIIGFSVSILISLFFGFYPAYKASKLNPIDALRGT